MNGLGQYGIEYRMPNPLIYSLCLVFNIKYQGTWHRAGYNVYLSLEDARDQLNTFKELDAYRSNATKWEPISEYNT